MPPTVDGADYRLRIFTPTRELPFAGHPSVGAAWGWARDMIGSGKVVQECGAGLLPVRWTSGREVAGGAPAVGPDLDGAALAAAVGLDPGDLDPACRRGSAGPGCRSRSCRSPGGGGPGAARPGGAPAATAT